MSTKPFITFGLTTYINNQERLGYLHQCIRSIINQTDLDWEFIISDDCSPIDLNLGIYKDDDRIKVYRQEKNLGIFGGFNFCLEKSNSKFFMPMGDDDLVDVDFVKIAKDIYQKFDNIQNIYFDHLSIDENGRSFAYNGSPIEEGMVLGGKDKFNEIVSGLFCGAPSYFCSLVDVDALKKIGGYCDYGTVTDEYVMLLFSLNFNGYYIKKPLMYIRRHSGNMSSIKNIFRVLEERKKIIPKLINKFNNDLNEESKKVLQQKLIEHEIGHLQLLREFTENGRKVGIKFFNKIIKDGYISMKVIVIFIIGIIFGKKSFACFSKAADLDISIRKIRQNIQLPNKYKNVYKA